MNMNPHLKFHFFILYKTYLIFINQNPFFFILYKTNLIFVHQISFFSTLQNKYDFSLRREHIHKTNLFKLILSSKCLLHVLQQIIQYHTKWYIMVIQILEYQTLFRRNECRTPSHSVTQPLNLGFLVSRQCFIFCFGRLQLGSRLCNFYIDCIQDQSLVKLFYQDVIVLSINEFEVFFRHVIVFYFFLFFL